MDPKEAMREPADTMVVIAIIQCLMHFYYHTVLM